ncbi:MAG: folylpolyglutamate synthase/dihydrofolate synthase family protein [bacterium]
MNYIDVIKYLNSLERFGIQLGLERITKLLELLGNPHKNLKCIHIAGTNGKGSVTTFIGEILKSAGFKVGIYTSPHFISFTERITINGIQIPESQVAEIISKDILPAIDILTRHSPTAHCHLTHPTYFEITTAVAFTYFAQEKVDIAVLEVGLGGRLDATNVVTPLVSVITSVNLEHQDVLGKKLEQIAYEKAGIIKQGVPVVTAATQPAVIKVIKKAAKQKNAPLYQLGKEIKFIIDKYPDLNSNYKFKVKGVLKEYRGLQTSLLGYHQIINATTSISTIEILQKHHGFKIATQDIKKGLLKAKIRGRLELIKKNSISFLLDGAHNPASASLLRKALKDYFPFRRLIFIIGILDDKDIAGIIRELLYKNENLYRVIITQSKINRAVQPEKIHQEVSKYTDKINILPTVEESIKHAESIATLADLICISGSLYTVAEAIEDLS